MSEAWWRTRRVTNHELALLLEVDEQRVADMMAALKPERDGDGWVVASWFLHILKEYRRLGKMEVDFDVKNIDENSGSEFLFQQESSSDLTGEVIKLYNEMLGDVLPPVRFRSEWREKMVRARTKQYLKNLDGWKRYFEIVRRSPFLLGKKKGVDWRANFDWLIRPNNMTKVLDGVYLEGTFPEYEKVREEGETRIGAVMRRDISLLVSTLRKISAAVERGEFHWLLLQGETRIGAVMKRDISLLVSTLRKISAAVERGEFHWLLLPKQQNKVFMTQARLALAVSAGVVNKKNYRELMNVCGFSEEDLVYVLREDYYGILRPLLEAPPVGELGTDVWTKNVAAAAVGILRKGEDFMAGHSAFLSAVTGAYDVISERERRSAASEHLSKILVPAGTFAAFFGK